MSIIESPEHGYFGGYLIVSALGRPVEFHCTAPVRPSRAQRILYGPTLEPFLLGEQIAGTLLQAAKTTPKLILANCDAALHIRSRSKVPLVLLQLNPGAIAPVGALPSPAATTLPASTGQTETSRRCADQVETSALEKYLLQFAAGYEADRDEVMQLLNELAHSVELDEPFGRIEEAIREAQRLGGGEHHDQAA